MRLPSSPPESPSPDPVEAAPRFRAGADVGRPALLAVLIAAAFFAAVAPTLRWQEFSGGSENLIVESVLEMHRGGPRLIPTLLGVPRVTKPPLTAWLTAAAVRNSTIARLSNTDPATRDAAFRELAWQVRWPSLVSSCAMILATYFLARHFGLGTSVALASAAVCGSTLLFLRFSRGATTDVQLALWVTVANAFLALAFFRNRPWAGCLGAGAALGLAFMSKGPVAFAQSILPFALLLAWRRWDGAKDEGGRMMDEGQADPELPSSPGIHSRSPRVGWLPPVVGLLLMLLIGLPWYVWVLHQFPSTLSGWQIEVTRVGATQLPPDPWYAYVSLFPWMLPWLAWFIAGVWVAALGTVRHVSVERNSADRAWRGGSVAALFLLLTPIVVMSFFKDKNERYLLPMLPPAALLAARAAVGWWQTRFNDSARDPAGRIVEAIHWFALLLLAVGVAVGGVFAGKLGLGEAWSSPAMATGFGLTGVAVVAVGYHLRRRARGGGTAVAAGVGSAAMLMVLLQFPAMRGYGRAATSDLKPLADAVWAQYPTADVYQYEPGGRSRTRIDLAIYLGRTTRPIGQNELPQAPGNKPRVVVFLERHASDGARLAPPWKEFARGAGRTGGWRAYVLPAAGTS